MHHRIVRARRRIRQAPAEILDRFHGDSNSDSSQATWISCLMDFVPGLYRRLCPRHHWLDVAQLSQSHKKKRNDPFALPGLHFD